MEAGAHARAFAGSLQQWPNGAMLGPNGQPVAPPAGWPVPNGAHANPNPHAHPNANRGGGVRNPNVNGGLYYHNGHNLPRR